MRSRSPRPILAILALAAAFTQAPSADGGEVPAELLDRLGRMARLYADTALRFSCDETLHATPGTTFKDSYIYIFGEDGLFHDYRSRRGDKKGREIDPAHFRIPTYLGQALSWVFLFRAERRGRIRFTLQGDDEAIGVPAVVIAFEPIPPIEFGINDWHGTAWVDPRTAQILKVRGYRSDDEGVRHQLEIARMAGTLATTLFRFSTTRTEFGVVKNGLRFPSLAVIEDQTHSLPPIGTETVETEYRVEQIYENYRFFSVRSAEEVQRLTGGPPPLPPPPPP